MKPFSGHIWGVLHCGDWYSCRRKPVGRLEGPRQCYTKGVLTDIPILQYQYQNPIPIYHITNTKTNIPVLILQYPYQYTKGNSLGDHSNLDLLRLLCLPGIFNSADDEKLKFQSIFQTGFVFNNRASGISEEFRFFNNRSIFR